MSDDNHCERHDVDIDAVPGHDRCPYCEMEQRRENALAERAQRHHPKVVDDCADITAYRR